MTGYKIFYVSVVRIFLLVRKFSQSFNSQQIVVSACNGFFGVLPNLQEVLWAASGGDSPY